MHPLEGLHQALHEAPSYKDKIWNLCQSQEGLNKQWLKTWATKKIILRVKIERLRKNLRFVSDHNEV